MAASASRFGDEKVEDFVQNQLSKKTMQSTKFAVKILRDFCAHKNLNTDFENHEIAELSNLLKDFYVNVRNQAGEIYSKSMLCAIRQGIRRFLNEPPHERSFDIRNDAQFKTANNVFNSMLKKCREEGKGHVAHKKSIPEGDLQRLYEHPRAINPKFPSGLLNKVLFEILFYFCRRGRENLRDLRACDFEIRYDESGRKYVMKKTSEKTKNHTGVTNENEGDGARMYETGTKMCPVASFELYLKKRNSDCDALLQFPRGSYFQEDDCWYENRPLGKNLIGQFMVKLSKEAELSDVYTNHCIRATTITTQNDVGFKDRDIISVSGHRNEKSLASYISDTKPDIKRKMSHVLSSITNNSYALVPYTSTSNRPQTIANTHKPSTCTLDTLYTSSTCTNTLQSSKNFSMVDFLENDDSDTDLLDVLSDIEKTVSL